MTAAAPAVDAGHLAVFDDLVRRSRARTAGGDRVAAAGAALVGAAIGAVESAGFVLADRSAVEGLEELRFDGAPGQTLVLTLGHPEGEEPAEVLAADVPFGVRFQSASPSADIPPAGAAASAVVVATDEWTGQAVSSVDLRLPLGDYLSADLDVDAAAVHRDVTAAVVVVRGYLP